jgi:hypothetical protein
LSFFGLQLGAVFFVIRMQKFAEEVALRGKEPRCRGLSGAADDVVDVR